MYQLSQAEMLISTEQIHVPSYERTFFPEDLKSPAVHSDKK